MLEREIDTTGVAVARLNQPERGNCLSDDLIAALIGWIDELEQGKDAAVLVIEGHPRVFCGGGDVHRFRSWHAWTGAERQRYLKTGIQPLFRRLLDSPLLTVACVEGAVVGAGLDLLLACDLRFAATSASVRGGYLDVGLVPAAGAPWHLARLVGTSRALELLVSSERHPASQLAEWGIFNHVYADDQLRSAVAATCRAIAGHGRDRVSRLKSLVGIAGEESFAAHLDRAAALLAVLGETRTGKTDTRESERDDA
ncbi:enoyl-CoA hydratase/isomerase family protein [Amycolatopsis acidiphila]|uniref:Enoyl-CoA hydratase/isomerase family protein n=1 Tax=Amycolatopsis acidiphila TaxID=715473 RepID=A0A558AI74_9PSEU|nr:enoyl-CoA hydratase/isomerase family protein [Amycolatopsis acidiphila]TVT23891.1 enoyl-CoA hydratase/isomerase family protein [Amycolatopsis acidiphila]UIJ61131.1 enoyl-CoA hydratase/isomerase family protein [Amycolatopsis acidiphila]GHG86532.1 enoyl-CoA hydratase [Amycolatopsis acidiphila]